jgi:type IV pilus assembly protein PilW
MYLKSHKFVGKSRVHDGRYSEHGLSLVELLVAVVIGLLMLLAISAVFIQGRTAGRALEDSQGVQEGARFALDKISYSLRMAKHAGCARGDSETIGLSAKPQPTATDVANLFEANKANRGGINDTARRLLKDTALINAFEGGIGFVIPSGTTTLLLPTAADVDPTGIDPNKELIAAPDVVYVAGASADFRHLSVAMTNPNDASISITSKFDGSKTDTTLYMISDCVRAEIFYGNATTLGTAINYDSLSNYQADLRKAYSAESTVAIMDMRNYFIAKSNNTVQFARDGWVLYEQRIESDPGKGYKQWGTPTPILSHISRFNIEFGIDNVNNDGVVDIYQRPSLITDWSKVISARVSLGVLGEQKIPTSGSAAAGSVTRVAQTYTVQVDIRN